jgi:hypothetical protein
MNLKFKRVRSTVGWGGARKVIKLGFAIQLIYFSGEDQVQSYWMAQPLSGRKTAGKTVQSEVQN